MSCIAKLVCGCSYRRPYYRYCLGARLRAVRLPTRRFFSYYLYSCAKCDISDGRLRCYGNCSSRWYCVAMADGVYVHGRHCTRWCRNDVYFTIYRFFLGSAHVGNVVDLGCTTQCTTHIIIIVPRCYFVFHLFLIIL